MAKVFQSPVCRFIAAPFVITGKDDITNQIMCVSCLSKKLVNTTAKAQIRYDHRIRSGTGKIKLFVFIEQSRGNNEQVSNS